MTPTEQTIYNILLIGGFILAPIVFLALLKIPAPYGRHARKGWGPQVNRKLGWVMMELPAVVFFAFIFLVSTKGTLSAAWVFFLLYEVHYLYRGLIFPFRLRTSSAKNPLLIVAMAILFNLWNTYLNGRYLGLHAEDYGVEWLTDPRFIIGIALFLTGFAINLHSDEILLRLRRGEDGGYSIPRGGMYRFVSCPNYMGECIEWIGWAVLTWSAPGAFFALWTLANLVPRAQTHHRWYQERFPDYPQERKAVIPFIY